MTIGERIWNAIDDVLIDPIAQTVYDIRADARERKEQRVLRATKTIELDKANKKALESGMSDVWWGGRRYRAVFHGENPGIVPYQSLNPFRRGKQDVARLLNNGFEREGGINIGGYRDTIQTRIKAYPTQTATFIPWTILGVALPFSKMIGDHPHLH